MKKILFVLFLFTLSTKAFSAGNYVVEYFDRNIFKAIDAATADSELILRSANTAAGSLCTNFNWGAYNAQVGFIAPQTKLATVAFGNNNSLQINSGTPVVGTRAYTRFDTSANTETAGSTTQYNVPSRTVDCTNGVIILDNLSSNAPDLTLGFLLRDANNWWESNPQPVLAGTNVLDFPLATMTWTQVDMAPGTGGEDMDQVDNKGEKVLTYLSSGTPTFTAIQGMGLVVKTPGTEASSNQIQIGNMLLGQVPKASGLTATAVSSPAKISLSWTASADATGYNVYRGTTAGGLYTRIATNSPGTTYDDVTAAPGTQYFYVVRGCISTPSATTPAPLGATNEASATIPKPLSGAKNWSVFK